MESRTYDILHIDDDEMILKIANKILSCSGFNVTSTSDAGVWKQEHERGRKFDLVIVDLMMPKISGFEVCRIIRHDTPDVPILVLSSKSLLAEERRELDAHGVAYATKPIGPVELLRRVRLLISEAPCDIN